jgi:Protein of unknown function (DUF551)
MSNWIKCSDRMPEVKEPEPGFFTTDMVLVWVRGGIAPAGNDYEGHMDVMCYYYCPKSNILADPIWHDDNEAYESPEDVTHWMPLPEAPGQ